MKLEIKEEIKHYIEGYQILIEIFDSCEFRHQMIQGLDEDVATRIIDCLTYIRDNGLNKEEAQNYVKRFCGENYLKEYFNDFSDCYCDSVVENFEIVYIDESGREFKVGMK